MNQTSTLWRALGPGLLLAGAAIGVSHLVQSTRAGAVYGMGFLGLILAANIFKYPAFRFGPQHAAATGTSLLEGYRRQGRWALVFYALLTLGTMFTVEAAVALVTAGLLKVALGVTLAPTVLAGALIALCATLLAVGQYRWLDAINKVVVLALTVSTLLATALLLPKVQWSAIPWWPDAGWPPKQIFFAAAVVGWMPSAIDVSVWHSLWTLARKSETRHAPTVREAVFDFHLGYFGTSALALCFLALGAGTMYGSGAVFSASAGGFAAQVIELYTQTLGAWARPVIGTCAFAVMFSTTLTVVDGFPRALAVLVRRFSEPEQPWTADDAHPAFRRTYWASLVLLGVGSIAVIALLLGQLKALVDVATTLSFLTAPALAWLNHRAITGAHVPAEAQPGPRLRAFSALSIGVLALFALGYLYLRVTT
jgi:Mn2+/Fe2+ NRAMP family transporter